MDNKKKNERSQVIRFISNNLMKLQVLDIEESETPDFILKLLNKKISIEHTQLIDPKTKQREKYLNKIIDVAHDKFMRNYSSNLNVHIIFKNIQLNSGKNSENNYADEVFRLIEEIYLNNKNFEFRLNSKKIDKIKFPTIEDVYVTNEDNFDYWQTFGAFLVEHLDINYFIKKISNKEKRLKNYHDKFDENWLLFVSNLGDKSSAYRTELLDLKKINSSFDKIFIFDFIADKIVIVK